jgi:hypothetical protein
MLTLACPANAPLPPRRRRNARNSTPDAPRLYVSPAELWAAVSPGIGEHPLTINGYPARVLTWTPDAWERLTERPAAATMGANGIFAMLVMD